VDVQRNNRVSALGAETARTLFGNRDPIGRKSASGTERVIGVMAPKGSVGRNQDEAVFVPLQQWLTSYRDEGLHVSPTVQTISVSPRSGKYQRCPVSDYKPAPATQDWGEDDFTAVSRTCYRRRTMSGILILMLATTASISLLVGGIGIMNIMLVSVTERTQEIGLRKAIGATSTDVLAQFTIEAVILSTVGGLFGILLGWGTLVVTADPSTSCDQSGGDCSSSSCFWGHWFGLWRGSSRSAVTPSLP